MKIENDLRMEGMLKDKPLAHSVFLLNSSGNQQAKQKGGHYVL